MPRRPGAFRQEDVVRALRAAREVGLEVIGYEIEPVTGKITVNTSRPPPIKETPRSALDEWLATDEGKAWRSDSRG